MTLPRTIRCSTSAWTKLFTAPFAYLIRTGYCVSAAMTRAIFNISVNSSTRMERYPTMIARSVATTVASLRYSRSWCKVFPAFFARTKRYAVYPRPLIDHFRVVFPVLGVGFCVARRTKCDKVPNLVRFPIIGEQVERLDVMHMMSFRNLTALLARITVSHPCRSALPFPVFSSICAMPTQPSGVVTASPFIACSPCAIARTTTSVDYPDGRGRTFKRLFANVATNCHLFVQVPDPMHLLPFTVTGKSAEMPLRLFHHVRLRLIRLFALFTSECNHASIISQCMECL